MNEYSVILFGLVAAVRSRYPSIDGWKVWVLAALVGVGLAAMVASDLHDVRGWLISGLRLAALACGLGEIAKYAGQKIGAGTQVAASVENHE